MVKSLKIRKLCALVLVSLLVLTVMLPTAALAATRQNNYPIVLCHGNAGWGEDEMLGYKYWGGFVDLEQNMTNAGYTTYTAAVGPFSSNWDRACELYAYIKGGTVDYGKAHSEKYGHARYGKTYPGLYTSWGSLTNGKINKIHIISHSQGGQTSRMLIQLLEAGSQEEKNATPTGLCPLFAGGKPWVSSLTTLCTPHDGTTLSDVDTDILKETAKQAIAAVATLAGLGSEYVYDFKLDQWGLKRNAGESYLSYSNRVWNSSIWDKSNKDFSFYDLGTDGAVKQNNWVKARSDVYYFSYASYATMKELITGYQIPNPLYMNSLFTASTLAMGSYTRNEAGRVIIDSSWWQNDGIVNTISENGPKYGTTDVIVNYTGTPQIGKWNFMCTKANVDHEDIIGRFGDVTNFFIEMAQRVGSLPVVS